MRVCTCPLPGALCAPAASCVRCAFGLQHRVRALSAHACVCVRACAPGGGREARRQARPRALAPACPCRHEDGALLLPPPPPTGLLGAAASAAAVRAGLPHGAIAAAVRTFASVKTFARVGRGARVHVPCPLHRALPAALASMPQAPGWSACSSLVLPALRAAGRPQQPRDDGKRDAFCRRN